MRWRSRRLWWVTTLADRIDRLKELALATSGRVDLAETAIVDLERRLTESGALPSAPAADAAESGGATPGPASSGRTI